MLTYRSVEKNSSINDTVVRAEILLVLEDSLPLKTTWIWNTVCISI